MKYKKGDIVKCDAGYTFDPSIGKIIDASMFGYEVRIIRPNTKNLRFKPGAHLKCNNMWSYSAYNIIGLSFMSEQERLNLKYRSKDV